MCVCVSVSVCVCVVLWFLSIEQFNGSDTFEITTTNVRKSGLVTI